MNNKLKPIIVLMVICIVASSALAFFNEITKDVIAEQDRLAEIAALNEVMPGVDVEALNAETVSAVFAQLTVSDEGIDAIYKATTGGNDAGYILRTTSKGYGGTVTCMTAIGNDGKIVGTKVLSHSETPGLGAKAAVNGDGSWISQYAGKTAGAVSVSKSGATGDQVNAISSATITSNAVTRCVNIAGEAFKVLNGGN